jgi:hypothetical protein
MDSNIAAIVVNNRTQESFAEAGIFLNIAIIRMTMSGMVAANSARDARCLMADQDNSTFDSTPWAFDFKQSSSMARAIDAAASWDKRIVLD